ncbi:hypothetical protein ACFU3E_26800 [Streptomyces sp. NPDC057424]|uniref:hypothetical protein n=1 Tax=Streptomyces sp. NPDC057424 TaxID=3346127 RepID=UPI00369FB55D
MEDGEQRGSGAIGHPPLAGDHRPASAQQQGLGQAGFGERHRVGVLLAELPGEPQLQLQFGRYEGRLGAGEGVAPPYGFPRRGDRQPTGARHVAARGRGCASGGEARCPVNATAVSGS